MIMMMVLSTFLDLLLHRIYKMRELAHISFLRQRDPPVHAPEGSAIPHAPNISTRTRRLGCQYPPAKWMHGADKKLERVNLNELKQQKAMGKLNQDIFALAFGTRQIPLLMLRQCQRKRRG